MRQKRVNLELEEKFEIITGIIQDTQNQPVSGVKITGSNPGYAEVFSNDQGQFTTKLPENGYLVFNHPDYYQCTYESRKYAFDKNREPIKITLERKTRAKIKVTDGDGNPVNYVNVSLFYEGQENISATYPQLLTLNEQGEGAVEIPSFLLSKKQQILYGWNYEKGMGVCKTGLTPSNINSFLLHLRLSADRVCGQVIDDVTAKPVANAFITPMPVTEEKLQAVGLWQFPDYYLNPYPISDLSGNFTLFPVSGENPQIYACHPDYGVQKFNVIVNNEKNISNLLRLKSHTTIIGYTSFPAREIYLNKKHRTMYRAQIDQNGQSVKPNTYILPLIIMKMFCMSRFS